MKIFNKNIFKKNSSKTKTETNNTQNYLSTINIEFERDYSNPSDKRVNIKDGASILNVEEFTLKYFIKKDYQGFICENHFWECFISLLFFNELLTCYIDNKYGLFFSPEIFRSKLTREQYSKMLKNRMRSKKSIRNKFRRSYYKYNRLDLYFSMEEERRNSKFYTNLPTFVDMILNSFEISELQNIVKMIIELNGKIIKGMPDLLLFKKNVPIFCEVKSPNDKLRSSQRKIIKYLTENIQLRVIVANLIEKNIENSFEKEYFFRKRKLEKLKRNEAKKKLERIFNEKIPIIGVPQIKSGIYDSSQFLSIINYCEIYKLKFIESFIESAIPQLTDLIVNNEFLKKLDEIFDDDEFSQERKQRCIESYFDVINNNINK